MKRALGLVMMVAVTATPVVGQWRHGSGTGPQVDTTQVVIVAGEVVKFEAGIGEGTPTLVVRDGSGIDHAFVLGPYRNLQAQGFVAQAGDHVEVQAYACPSCPGSLAVAEVKNLTRGLTLVLRTDDGAPAWTGVRGHGVRQQLHRSGQGTADGAAAQGARTGPGAMHRGCGGSGPDMTRVATFSGTIASFVGAPGEGMPVLTLATGSGEMAIVLSPFRALARAGYTPVAGARLDVVAAPVALQGTDHWVAISLKDLASGLEIAFRDAATGFPVGGRARS